MRYLLIAVGLVGILLGGMEIAKGNPNVPQHGELLIQVGALFLAVGLATVDIVGTFKVKSQKS